ERDHLLPVATLSQALPFSPAEIKSALKKLTKANTICPIGAKHFTLASFWKDLSKGTAKIVKDYHKSHPDHTGMSTELLKKNLGAPVGILGLFDALLGWLADNDFRVSDNLVCHESHSLELPPELEAPAAEILRTLDTTGLNPPLPGELQATGNHEAAYRFLSRTGQIIPLDPKVTLSKKSYEGAVATVTAHLTAQGQATASELRQELGTSRKILMPLLERLDRDKITVRNGDHRTLV
ncbi:SelB C-terminal domain-containing protein, partial [Akkermansiaceae bacterium]|nr:SelB C-terminal domain-containing protein [Akkermansiaceae bacterium]